MPSAYSYVDGDHLVAFVCEVRDVFEASRPGGDDDARRPNSVRLVAIDLFEGKTITQQLAVLRDLMEVNPGLIVERELGRDIFEYSDTPTAYITDLVCGIVCQILFRDQSVRELDYQRITRLVEPAEELEEQ
jgi:hypothetical protein